MDRENWQLQCAELKQRGAYLYKSKIWSDCELQVDDITIKAHKLILAMSSPVLAKKLYGGALKAPVRIYDVRVEVFNILLEYIYSDNLILNCSKDACDLYYTAKKLRLPCVAKECVKYLIEQMGPDNVCHIYSVAWENNDLPLQKACEQIFITRTKEVINNKSFYDLTMEMASKVFSLDPLNIDNELDVFNAAVEFARQYEIKEIKKKHKERYRQMRKERAEREENKTEMNGDGTQTQTNDDIIDGPTPTKKAKLADITENSSPSKNVHTIIPDTEDASSDNSESSNGSSSYNGPALFGITIRDQKQKLKFRELIKPIRFLTLSPQEFAECNNLFRLLSQSEVLKLSMNIASKETSLQMPEGLSQSMVPRTLISKDERAKLSGVFRAVIPNFKYIKKYESPPFYVRNMMWTLMALLFNDNEDYKDFILLAVTGYLETTCMEQEEWVKNTKIKVKFYTHKNVPKHLYKIALKYNMLTSDDVTWSTKIHRSHIFDPANGFIDEFNTITYKLYIDTGSQDDSSKPESMSLNSLKSATEANSSNVILKVSKPPAVASTASTLPVITSSVSQSPTVTVTKTATPIPSRGSTIKPSSITAPNTALPTSILTPSTTSVSKAPTALAQTTSTKQHSAPSLTTYSASRPSTNMTCTLTPKSSTTIPSALLQSRPSAAIGTVRTIPSPISTPTTTKPHPSLAPNISGPRPSATVTDSIKAPKLSPAVSSSTSTLPQTSVTKLTPVNGTPKPLPQFTSAIQASKNVTTSVAASKMTSQVKPSNPLSASQSLAPNTPMKSTSKPLVPSNSLTESKLSSTHRSVLQCSAAAATGLTQSLTTVTAVTSESVLNPLLTNLPRPSPSNEAKTSLSSQTKNISILSSSIPVKPDVKEALAKQSQLITSALARSSSDMPERATAPQIPVGKVSNLRRTNDSSSNVSPSSATSSQALDLPSTKFESQGSVPKSSESSSNVLYTIVPPTSTQYSNAIKSTVSEKAGPFSPIPSKIEKPKAVSPLCELIRQEDKVNTLPTTVDPYCEQNLQNLDATLSQTLPISNNPAEIEMVDITLTVRDPLPNFSSIDLYGNKNDFNGTTLPTSKLLTPDIKMIDIIPTVCDPSPNLFDPEPSYDTNNSKATTSKKSPITTGLVEIFTQDITIAPPVWFPKTTALVSSQPLHAVTRAWPTRPAVSKTTSVASSKLLPKNLVISPANAILINESSSSALNAVSENHSNFSSPLKFEKSPDIYKNHSNNVADLVKQESMDIEDCGRIHQPQSLRQKALASLDFQILETKAIKVEISEEYRKSIATNSTKFHNQHDQCKDKDVKSDFKLNPFFQPPSLIEIAFSALGPLITNEFDHSFKSEGMMKLGVEQTFKKMTDSVDVSKFKEPPSLKQIAFTCAVNFKV